MFFLFFSLIILVVGFWGFLKYNKPNCILPEIDYRGMSKALVLKEIYTDAIHDPLSQQVLLHIPLGRTINILKQKDSREDMEYLYGKSIWDVNYMYSKNKLKGGYYFYRLYFNEAGNVDKQEKIFQSDIGLFGL